MDHIFIDVGLDRGEITAIALVRTSSTGEVLATYNEEVRTKDKRELATMEVVWAYAMEEILKPAYSDRYVIIAVHAENDRKHLHSALKKEPFGKHRWLDLLTLAWPLCYNEHISDTGLPAICRYFDIPYEADGSILRDCEACVRCYFAIMKKYKIALYGESVAKDLGGKGYEFLLRLIR